MKEIKPLAAASETKFFGPRLKNGGVTLGRARPRGAYRGKGGRQKRQGKKARAQA